jgi:hypothetical protein
VDSLLARTDELARRWAIALILALPLERIGEIPLEAFARDAPLLCSGVIRALASDEQLERIAQGARGRAGAGEVSPAQRLGGMTGARDGRAAVEALEALRGVLWEALLDELHPGSFDQPSPARMVADLADRLAYVCSSALGSSLVEPAPDAEQLQLQRTRTRAAAEPDSAHRAFTAPVQLPASARAQRAVLGNGVVIVDEAQSPQGAQTGTAEPRAASRARALGNDRPLARRPRGRALPWDTPLQGRGSAREEPA